MLARMLILITLFGFVLFPVMAEEKNANKGTPESVEGIETISADQLAEMLITIDNLIVIDARIKKGRVKGYIDSSIHLPDVKTNCDSLSKIITDKNQKVVFYCSSSKCGRSLNAVTIAQTCNYRNLYWFRGGFKDWKNNGYPFVK